MCADDMTLYFNCNYISEVTMNNNLSNIRDWLSSNKLFINILKANVKVYKTHTHTQNG